MHLLYELHLTNFATSPLYVSRIEVLNADAAAAEPIATNQIESVTWIGFGPTYYRYSYCERRTLPGYIKSIIPCGYRN